MTKLHQAKDQSMDKNKINISAGDLSTSTAKKKLKAVASGSKLQAEYNDLSVKGLKLTYLPNTKAPDGVHIKLHSLVYINTGDKREKIRKVWYSNLKDPKIPTSEDLQQLKADASTWYKSKIDKSRYNLFVLADYLEPYINSKKTYNTKRACRNVLKHFDRFMNEDIENINHIEICNLIQSKFPNTANNYISFFCTFLDYVYRATDNDIILKLLTKIKAIAPKKITSNNHFKTIESTDNTELTEKLIQGFTQLILHHSKQETIQQVLTRFLIPVRYNEIKSLQSSDILEDRAIFRETKTEKNNPFQVPITPRVREQLLNHPVNQSVFNLNITLKKYFNLTSHSARSIFDTYFSRTGKYQFIFIEACLTHKEKSAVIRAYRGDTRNYYYTQRIPIMKDWYDFIFDCWKQAQERAKGQNVEEMKANI